MDKRKTMIRFFTVADYQEEERWLREQHRKGWRLVKTIPPCVYIFEACQPAEVVYRLDYKNNTESGEYLQLFRDYGWEYFNSCMGWLYFRRPLLETDTEQDTEIFSDDGSRINTVNHILNTRMLPLLLVFFACLLPTFIRNINGSMPAATGLTIVLAVLVVIYLYLFVHCGRKLYQLRKQYKESAWKQ